MSVAIVRLDRPPLQNSSRCGKIFVEHISEARMTDTPISSGSGYQAELDYFATQAAARRALTRLRPEESRLAVELGLEELRQLGS